MDNIKITIAKPEDAISIRQVQHDTWIETYPNATLGITVEAIKERVSKYILPEKIESLKESLSSSSQSTWIATLDTQVIGFCTALKEEKANRVVAIYVLPQYHGKGMGKSLIQPALKWLGTKKPIEVEVASYNEQAIQFYSKYGFKKNGKVGNSSGIPTIFLTKDPSKDIL